MSVFGIDFKRNIGELIAWTVVVSALTAIFILLYNMFGSVFQPESFTSRAEALPSIIRGVMGLNEVPDLSHIYQFTAYIFQFILVLSAFYGGIIGAKALSGEESKGTIEFLYAQPVTRSSILRQKIISGILRYLIYNILLYIVVCTMIWVLNREMNISGIAIDLVRIFVSSLFVGFTFMAIGLLFSSLFRSNAESISVTIAIILITYVVGLVGNIIGRLHLLIYISPIQGVLPITVINKGFSIFAPSAYVLIMVLATLLAVIRYKKKDFLV